MSRRTIVASIGAAVVLAAGAGGAYAAGGFGGGGSGTSDSGSGKVVHIEFGAGPAGSEAVAAYLGLSQSELRTQLDAGKTLAQIATAQGKSVAGLEDVIYNDAKAHLDEAVANGKLTASDEQTMLADLKSHLDDIVNNTGPPGGLHVGVEIFGSAVAGYLGLTESELRTQLESGKTLAEIASGQGKSVDGLKAAILAEAKSHLDEAVAAGKLSSAQAEQMLADLKSHIDDLVNRTGPPHPGDRSLSTTA
jgi:polyhydroxyalkanoate synthesis regulator phasin